MTDTRTARRRVEERAYFLWTNRTGRRWWDLGSNWLEAEAMEAAIPFGVESVGNYTWPFSLHFDLDVVPSVGPVGWTDKDVLDCTAKDLRSLSRAYYSIAHSASDYDVIIGFACGAIPAMNLIAAQECERLFGVRSPVDSDQVEALQRRLHVVPGVSWHDGSEIPFLRLLGGTRGKTLLVDCSFTGGAFGALGNLLDGNRRSGDVVVHGIAVSSPKTSALPRSEPRFHGLKAACAPRPRTS